MTATDNPMVRSYLTRLEAALAHVPADERSQIVDGIEEHVAAALAELDAPTEADVRDILARVWAIRKRSLPTCINQSTSRPRAPGSSRPALLWIGAVVGVFDLLMVSTSQVGPIEFAFLASTGGSARRRGARVSTPRETGLGIVCRPSVPGHRR